MRRDVYCGRGSRKCLLPEAFLGRGRRVRDSFTDAISAAKASQLLVSPVQGTNSLLQARPITSLAQELLLQVQVALPEDVSELGVRTDFSSVRKVQKADLEVPESLLASLTHYSIGVASVGLVVQFLKVVGQVLNYLVGRLEGY